MPFWRREEPEHERLAREAGIELDADDVAAPPEGPFPPQERIPFVGILREPGIHGLHQQREWDAVVTAEAPELDGDAVTFAALPDGTLIVDEDVEDGALAPLADAIEASLDLPYSARCVRRDGGVWAAGAKRIEVAEVPGIDGDEVQLTSDGASLSLEVDREPALDRVPSLESLGSRVGEAYVVRGSRLDGDLWEVEVSAL